MASFGKQTFTGSAVRGELHCCSLISSNKLPAPQGFDVAVAVLHAVNAVLPIHVTWVCQNRPDEAHLPVLGRCNLTFDLHVSVPQARVRSTARSQSAHSPRDCDIFLPNRRCMHLPLHCVSWTDPHGKHSRAA